MQARPGELTTLPPVTPDSSIAPVVQEPQAAPALAPPVRPEERPRVVIKTILGLVALLALAYLGGHPTVERWEARLRVSQLMTAGLPFLALGLVARLPRVGILNDQVMADLSPVLRIGLGWIGFVAGSRFDTRKLANIQSGAVTLVALVTSVPFLLVALLSSAVLLAVRPAQLALEDSVFLRDALLLGTAGAMTASNAALLLPQSDPAAERVSRTVRLEELAGIAGLTIVAAYFRPQGAAVSWQLPGTGWLLLTVGLGTAVGGLVYLMLTRATQGAEFIVLTVGSVSFAAGLAANLRLSSVAVCFVAGLLIINFPSSYRERLRTVLEQLERPVYLVFLAIVGAIWRADSLAGWLLLPVFVMARMAGKWLGTRLAARRASLKLSLPEQRVLTLAPMGPLAIAIVVNAQLLYPGGSISDIVTAVMGGALITEGLVQFFSRREPAPSGPRSPGAEAPP